MAALRAMGLAALLLSTMSAGCRQVQDRLLYYPVAAPATAPSPPAGWTRGPLTLTRPDGVVLQGWLVKPEQAAVALVIYFGGNGEELSWLVPMADRFGGRAVALVNYRGYGNSTGRPSEAALFGDAVALFDKLKMRGDVDGTDTAVMGRSLGTGVAVHVAAQRPVDRVVLVSPYDSIAAIAAQRFPLALVRAVLSDRYDSASIAAAVRTPLLVVVGGRDDIIPALNSRALFASWGGEKKWVDLPHAGHNDVQEHSQYWEAIADFLRGNGS
jgi:uncharacterized protein